MEGSGEPNYLKGEGLSPVIELVPKGDGQIDLSQWHGLFPEHNAVKRCSGWAEVRLVDAHLVECLGVHDVEATTSIHQYFGELLWTDDRVDDKRIPPWVWDGIRMVGLVEGYGGLRPPEEGRCGQLGRVDLAACDLLTMFGVIGHRPSEDHEAAIRR